MNPKPFAFGPSAAKKLRGHLNGFILKIWQWSEEYEKLRPTQRINKRSLPLTNETFFITKVTETVVLITFNDTSKYNNLLIKQQQQPSVHQIFTKSTPPQPSSSRFVVDTSAIVNRPSRTTWTVYWWTIWRGMVALNWSVFAVPTWRKGTIGNWWVTSKCCGWRRSWLRCTGANKIEEGVCTSFWFRSGPPSQ